MTFPRSSGILLHPTSLPGRYGIGDLGKNAYRFVDFLVEAEQSVWQVLPLGPTSYGDSPYQSPCAFAGNPNMISLDKLKDDGYLEDGDFADVPRFPTYRVDFGPVIEYHAKMLHLAYDRFQQRASQDHRAELDQYNQDNADWLDDYALFAALKNHYGGKSWTEWPDKDEALYDKAALDKARESHAEAVGYHRFCQWQFYRQWQALKSYANEKNVRLMGDIPIFVAHDSSDVWGNRQLYHLDENGNPRVIAGVPPDYFSETGQRWGNPLYRWDVMKDNGYDWWMRRVKRVLDLVDLVRIDHFRGFQAYWEIPASEPTAVNGTWVEGPNADLFHKMRADMGELPIVAEDLGVITPEVEALRDGLNLPGMQVLQFAFDGECGSNTFLPHHHSENTVVYTGTHDNNTTYGWWHSEEAHDGIQDCVKSYFGGQLENIGDQPHWALIRLALSSVAHTAIVPLQDVLGFGGDTRMNTPGKEQGNWSWRFGEEELNNPAKGRLATLTRLYSRHPGNKRERINY